jgi:hypothetical protein
MNLISHVFFALLIQSLCCINLVYSQDVEPRRWSSLPIESNIIGVGHGYTTGDVSFDPILQVEDAILEVNSLLATYIQPFKIGTKLHELMLEFLLDLCITGVF